LQLWSVSSWFRLLFSGKPFIPYVVTKYVVLFFCSKTSTRHVGKSQDLIVEDYYRFTSAAAAAAAAAYGFGTGVGACCSTWRRPWVGWSPPPHLLPFHQIFSPYSSRPAQVLAGRELTRLAGFSQRVSLLLDVLQELEQGSYCRAMVQPLLVQPQTRCNFWCQVQQKDACHSPGSGEVIACDRLIEFTNVRANIPPRLNIVTSHPACKYCNN
jgi:hypothetical protein